MRVNLLKSSSMGGHQLCSQRLMICGLEEASPRTPGLSRGRPCESKRWGDAHSGCPRGLAAMQRWHGTLLGVAHVARTSGAAFL